MAKDTSASDGVKIQNILSEDISEVHRLRSGIMSRAYRVCVGQKYYHAKIFRPRPRSFSFVSEAKIQEFAHKAGISTPRLIATGQIDDTKIIVSEWVVGKPMHASCGVDTYYALGCEIGGVLASLPPLSLQTPGHGTFSDPGQSSTEFREHAESEALADFSAQSASIDELSEIVRDVSRRFSRYMPDNEPPRFVHGDLRAPRTIALFGVGASADRSGRARVRAASGPFSCPAPMARPSSASRLWATAA